MEIARLVLEYVRAAFSPQMVAGIIAIAGVAIFKDDIRGLLRRVAKIKLPGGSEFSTSQLERTSEEPPAGLPPPAAPPEPDSLHLNPEQARQLKQIMDAWQAEARLWEYRFLNYFFVPSTQMVLDWLAGLQTRTTIQMFDSCWLPAIPNAEERKMILNVLQGHHLIEEIGELIGVTDKGREYIQFRGPLPTPAAEKS